jgi:hypothetical protein
MVSSEVGSSEGVEEGAKATEYTEDVWPVRLRLGEGRDILSVDVGF